MARFRLVTGSTVFFGIQNEREWANFCATVLRQPALATDPRFDSNSHRQTHREALTAIIVDVFALSRRPRSSHGSMPLRSPTRG